MKYTFIMTGRPKSDNLANLYKDYLNRLKNFGNVDLLLFPEIGFKKEPTPKQIELRLNEEAKTIIETQKTLRDMEQLVQVSKSTIHKDMQQRLIELDEDLYEQVQNIFENHIKIRHIHGGESTKKKYMSKLKKL